MYNINLFKVITSFLPVLEQLVYYIGDLDVICSFANVVNTSKNQYTRPIMNTNRNLSIKQGRHFILDQNEAFLSSNKSSLIPNNCIFDSNNNTKNTSIILTGLNMGGKSTYLRQNGLIIYLAHIGMYIPASQSSDIPIVDKIITRVGADDNLLKGVSTFMSEMLEVSALLKSSTENSFLLIDEIGRGTSTKDGLALSYAILEYITSNIKSYCLYATHFHELTTEKYRINNTKKAFLEYSIGIGIGNISSSTSNSNNAADVKMHYKLKEGSANMSLGVNLFKSMNFENELLNEYCREIANI